MISLSACESTHDDIILEDFWRLMETTKPRRLPWLFPMSFSWPCVAVNMTVLMLSFDFRRNLAHSVVMIDPTNPRIWKDAVVAAVLFALLFFVDWIASFITGY